MHVDEAAIVNDFLDNHQDLLAEHRRRLYYQCQLCRDWFDEPTDISQGWCKECRERELSEEVHTTLDIGLGLMEGNLTRKLNEDQDETRRQFRKGLADTIKPPKGKIR